MEDYNESKVLLDERIKSCGPNFKIKYINGYPEVVEKNDKNYTYENRCKSTAKKLGLISVYYQNVMSTKGLNKMEIFIKQCNLQSNPADIIVITES